MRDKIVSFMEGRNGADELNGFIVAICAVLCIVDLFLNTGFLSVLLWMLIIVLVWRTLSRDVHARRAENDKFCSAIEGPRHKMNQWLNRWRNRKTTLYFKCSGCKTWLSVPRGKGTLRVVCPNCKKETIKKS